MSLATANGIAREVFRLTGYKLETIRKPGRPQKIVRVRHAIAKALRERTDWSYPMIARYLGRTDHSTAIHACTMADERVEQDPKFARLLTALRNCDPCTLGDLEKVYASRRKKKGAAKPEKVEVVLFVAVKKKPAIDLDQFSDDGMNDDGETLEMHKARIDQLSANDRFLAALNRAMAA